MRKGDSRMLEMGEAIADLRNTSKRHKFWRIVSLCSVFVAYTTLALAAWFGNQIMEDLRVAERVAIEKEQAAIEKNLELAASLRDQSIAVVSSKQTTATEAIALCAENEQIIADLNEKLREQSVLLERTRQLEFRERQKNAKEVADLRAKIWTLARSTRTFLHAYHDPEQMTDHLHNARAWWTFTNLKDRMGSDQIELGSNLILHIYSCFEMIQSWTGDEPLADD